MPVWIFDDHLGTFPVSPSLSFSKKGQRVMEHEPSVIVRRNLINNFPGAQLAENSQASAPHICVPGSVRFLLLGVGHKKLKIGVPIQYWRGQVQLKIFTRKGIFRFLWPALSRCWIRYTVSQRPRSPFDMTMKNSPSIIIGGGAISPDLAPAGLPLKICSSAVLAHPLHVISND